MNYSSGYLNYIAVAGSKEDCIDIAKIILKEMERDLYIWRGI